MITHSEESKKNIYQLLIFKIMGINFGVDTEQIVEIFDPEELDRKDITIKKFDDLISFKSNNIIYNSPKLLMIRQEEKPRGIIVEAPDDMIFVNRAMIRPIPKLIAEQSESKAIWGTVIHNKKIMLIVDFWLLT